MDIHGARDEILGIVRRNINNNIVYFNGWSSFGAAAVLRSIAQVVPSMKDPPPELCFGRTIYIDCSVWESRRVTQRKIAEKLKLDHKTMALFDKQDDEDDFNGVDHDSRDVIRNVSAVIGQSLRESKFMMIFLNGSDDEFLPGQFGTPEYHCIIIWTFTRRFAIMQELDYWNQLIRKLRYTDIFIHAYLYGVPHSHLDSLFHEEAATIVAGYPCIRGRDKSLVIDCFRYGLFLHRSSHKTIGSAWAAHAPNFWICDGIIQERDRAREIGKALHSKIGFEGDASQLDDMFAAMMQHPETSYLIVEDNHRFDDEYGKKPYRWVFITSKNKIFQDNVQNILAKASSVFLAFDWIGRPRLSNDLFKQCNSLVVLVLSYCAFNFVSPPFLHCHTLRFLGLDRCTHVSSTTELEGGDYITNWTCLYNLWVLDLRYTDWDEILSGVKIDLMVNLTELNIEGVRCWRYTSQLQKKLPYLRRLRIIKPMHQEESTIDTSNSFMDKTNLEILDMSGNSDMKNLPTSLSKAIKLQVLVLDGCDGLENVVLSNSLLTSFSFDGYGPASHWTSTGELPSASSRPDCPSSADKKDVKTSRISLQGCTLLKNLFIRGLPNLLELDISGCAIMVLDLETMVVDLPKLRRLILMGCENLRAIRWGTQLKLELLCVDTRAGTRRIPESSIVQHKRPFKLQVLAATADARFARSLAALFKYHVSNNIYFDINITDSAVCGWIVQPKGTRKEIIEPTDQQNRVVPSLYSDIFSKIANDTTPMQAFPQPPAQKLDRHIEIGPGSRNVDMEIEVDSVSSNLGDLMAHYTQSLHVHDVSTSTTTPKFTDALSSRWQLRLRWCCVERCRNLSTVFSPIEYYCPTLETIWVSNLLMARNIWSKCYREIRSNGFEGLQHLHLHSCPSLLFALPVPTSSFPSLKTLHIIHCGALRHVFERGHSHFEEVTFPELITIHLHDLPALRQICELKMVAPALETIRTRGCWSLRRLPALKGREPGTRRPTVEMEKDMWDALEWDGVDDGHHPSLYEAPVHSRYYKKRMLKGTVLR
ncbi:hypothetical protein ACP4OV_018517 [Aristida adscensionis]